MITEENKSVFKWVQIVLIILAVFLGAQALIALKNLRNIDPVYNSISVTGEGEAVSLPDVATFSFSVSADASVVSEAQTEVTEKMNDIIAGLKGLGIEERDIKTTNYSVYPKYSYPEIYCITVPCPRPTTPKQDGYTVSHDISVKVRNTEKAGDALAVVGGEGATNVSGVSFTVDDPDKILEEARTLAIQDAREKAKVLAKELDVRLVRIVSFYDNSGGPIPYYAEGLGGSVSVARDQAAPAPTLPTGENKVTVNVTVVYEIR